MKRHKPYSEDLIRRVVHAYRNRGDRDAAAIQKQFGIGRAALFRWVREANAQDSGRKPRRAAKGSKNRPTEFGTIIRQAREQKGLSQIDLEGHK